VYDEASQSAQGRSDVLIGVKAIADCVSEIIDQPRSRAKVPCLDKLRADSCWPLGSDHNRVEEKAARAHRARHGRGIELLSPISSRRRDDIEKVKARLARPGFPYFPAGSRTI
jgi:hypothetical protein